MTKCKYANKYKATRPPKCNGGDPCNACTKKWKRKIRFEESFSPGILVVSEKHGTFYYDAITIGKLKKTCLHLLKERYHDGWYGTLEMIDRELDKQPKPELSIEQINALPDGEIKKLAIKKLTYYNNNIKYLEEEKIELNNILNTINNNDGISAWYILMNRSDREYEQIAVEQVMEI